MESASAEQRCGWEWQETDSRRHITDETSAGVRFCECFWTSPFVGALTRVQVLAEVVPGGALNYDELVVYKNEAVQPSYLVMYRGP